MAEEKVNSLVMIQNELKAPKNQFNKFGNYHYRSCEDILNALKPLLFKHHAHLIMTDKPVMVGDWHYIEATANYEAPDIKKVSQAYAREDETRKGMSASQATGAASSYARKYALNGLFLIDDAKDSDTNEYQNQTRQSSQKAERSQQPKMNNHAKSNPTIMNAKKQLIDTFIKQIGKFIGKTAPADLKAIHDEAIKLSKNDSRWEKANLEEKATITAGVLEKWRDSMKK
ncbi:ERF family protein [Lactobacillus amylolyticus]|uniref:ERF family protein n=1 Tax=Lactobacillus amylolyticus TaxID=83683 RepID=UPI002490F6E7|nr:ERF family protein [Lactobacillus amylolyticus]